MADGMTSQKASSLLQVGDLCLVVAGEVIPGDGEIVEGALLRLPIPSLNAERRQELAKVAHKYAEHARVAVRNVRREGMDLLKRLDKMKGMLAPEV